MSVIAMLMFGTLTFALAFGIYQLSKTEKQLPDDTSHLKPERKLQRMDRQDSDRSVRGTKKDPLKA